MRPKQTTTRKFVSSLISWSSHGAQLRSSSGVGLLPGGAQRATARNPQPAQLHPVVARNRRGLRRKSSRVQHRIQKIARSVAREQPPCAIRAVRSRRQSQRHHARLRVAERRHGTAPVLPIGIGPPPHPRHLRAMRAQARAKLARNDARIQRCKSSRPRP